MSDITWTNTTVRLGDLKPWADNPRTSSKAQARRILKSFEQYGQAALICVDPSGNVLDGHQRLSALLTVHGPDYTVEARQSSRPLTDDERRGLVLALANATGSWNWDSLSGWNTETLTDWGFDKDTLKGWKSDVTALGEFLKSEAPAVDAEPQTDRAAELLEKWKVSAGDLWLIGDHRLICGDCTDAATVARVMDGERAELLLTDPPYGTGGWKRETAGAGSNPKAVHVQEEWDTWQHDTLKALSEQVDRVACFAMNLEPAFITFADFKTKRLRYWKKNDPRPSFGGRIVESVEPVLVCSHDGSALIGEGENWIEASTPRANRDKDGTGHPYQKPLIVIEWLMRFLSAEGGVVLESYSGSGTTLVACENLRRRCRAIEISPAYVAVALERMSTAFPHLPIRRAE